MPPNAALPSSSAPTMTLPRFKARMAAVVLLINLLMVMVVTWTLYASHQQQEKLALITGRNLTRLIEQDIGGSLDKIDLTLLSIAEEANRVRGRAGVDAGALNAFITHQAERVPEISDARIVDAQGILRYGTGQLPPNLSVADRDYFIHLRDHAEAGLIVSKPIVSRINGKRQFVLARRLSQPGGTFAGMVVALIELDNITRRFATLDVGARGVITLSDLDRTVVARYPAPADQQYQAGVLLSAPEYLEQLRLRPEAGNFQATSTVDGVRRLYSYRKIPKYPYYINVGLARTDYLRDWWQDVVKNFALTAVSALVTIGLALLMTLSWKRLLRQEETFRVLLESSPYPLVISDTQGRIALVNRQVEALFGYRSVELLGQSVEMLIPERFREDHVNFLRGHIRSTEAMGVQRDQLLWALTKEGREVPVNISLSPIETEHGLMVAAAILDISERRVAEEKIEFLAYRDPLTGLPNRRLLIDRLQQALAASARSERMGALFLLDLDNFKTLNDTLGHEKGDELLRLVGQRLVACVREVDTVARLGGDEFVLMVEDMSESAEDAATQAETLGEKILAALNIPYALADGDSRSTPSIGVSLFSGHQHTIDELLKQADLAMYQAKTAGRNTVRFFDPRMQALVSDRAALETDLRDALKQQQFTVYYQPQLVGAGYLTGAEALLRWQHPRRGMVSPVEFIPLAEDTGLILPLGRWVLETACAQLALWAAQPRMAHVCVAVNISAKQLQQADFVQQVLEVLDMTGANPQRLKLELTESLLVSDVEITISKMKSLKARGVRFSLDDFGTGYSSLSYLKLLPLDQLKIDQSFVRGILSDPNDAAIAKMIIVLAESLGLMVIAEGVETEAQREFLARHRCHDYQGYLFSRPLPLVEFEAFATRV